MPNTETLTITLPSGLAAKVREQVAAGVFADESDLIRQSLETFVPDSGALGMSDAEFDELLRREVLPVIAAMEADPSRGIPLEEARARMAERHRQYTQAAA